MYLNLNLNPSKSWEETFKNLGKKPKLWYFPFESSLFLGFSLPVSKSENQTGSSNQGLGSVLERL